jgi:general secretion pathway protein F
MAIFEYKGVSGEGKTIKGTVDADSSKSARLKLKQRGVYISEIKERTSEKKGQAKSVISFGGSVNTKNLTLMIRQLATS